MGYRDAASRRSHFHIFFKALARDYNLNGYIKRMSDVATTLIISIQPSRARGNEPVELVFYVNPMERAMASELPKDLDVEMTDPGTGETYDPDEIERLIAEKEEGDGV